MSPEITTQNLQELEPVIADIAQRAGERILEIGPEQIRYKSDSTPVTLADMEAHLLISQALDKLQLCPLVSEESVDDEDVNPDTHPLYWLIDPLDGTQAFINKSEEFAVNIALIRDGKPILGATHAPAWKQCLTGGEGLGVRQWSGEHSQVVRTDSTDDGLRITHSRESKNINAICQRARELGHHPTQVACSSSLKFSLLVLGKADIYPRVGNTAAWDIASGQALVEGAGGIMLNLQGEPMRYTGENWLNPGFVACIRRDSDWRTLLDGIE